MTTRNLSAQRMFELWGQRHRPECRFTATSRSAFSKWQAATRPRVMATLGDFPQRVPLQPELLNEWDCPAFLLIAGGSSILAGEAPKDTVGWSCGLGDDNAQQRLFLANASLSGSGLSVKGNHILDPRTGQTAPRQSRAWALTDVAAESDALSTACMVMSSLEIGTVLDQHPSWLIFLYEEGKARPIGSRALPPVSEPM